MEYILGSAVTLLTILVSFLLVKKVYKKESVRPAISQSRLFKFLSEYEQKADTMNPPNTQSYNHLKNSYLRVMIVEDKAYWIKNNQLYVADCFDGVVDKDSTREVDTMSMSKVELEQTMFIVETLSEDK